jgi:hypothetical protein
MKRVDYWQLKSQVATAESAADTYPSGRYRAAGRLINRSRNPEGFLSSAFALG